MRVTLEVSGTDRDVRGASQELRSWLTRHPEFRGRLGRESGSGPAPGEMGAGTELLTLLLAPGGVTAALGAAVVAWLQTRRGNQTVTVTLPDGTQVVVSSERVRGLTAGQTGEVAQRVAEALGPRPSAGESDGGTPSRVTTVGREERSGDALPAGAPDSPSRDGD